MVTIFLPRLATSSIMRLGVGERTFIPRHVPLTVRVFNVEPQDVVRDVVLIETFIHFLDVFFVAVVPSALVVTQGEHRRHRRRARSAVY